MYDFNATDFNTNNLVQLSFLSLIAIPTHKLCIGVTDVYLSCICAVAM